MELSTEEKSKLAAGFIEQAPPGEVNDVINDIRSVVASDEALMPHVLPRLRAYNLAQLHTVEHESSTSLISTAAILNGSDERYVDPRSKKSFAFDHVTLTPSSYEEYRLPEEFESVRATLDKSLLAYTRDHFATGVCAVFSSANHEVQLQGISVGEKEIGDEEVKAALEEVVHADEDPKGPAADSRVSVEGSEPTEAKAVGDEEVQAALEGAIHADEDTKVTAETAAAVSASEPAQSKAEPMSDTEILPEREEDLPGPKLSADSTYMQVGDEANDTLGEPHEHKSVTGQEASPQPAGDAAKAEDDLASASEISSAEHKAGLAVASRVPIVSEPAPTLPEVIDPVFTLQVVGNRYNPQNFWTGRWRSTWVVERARVTGNIHVDVHYYEQGNVQLATSHAATFEYSDVAQIIDTIAKLEANYQLSLNDTYNALGDKAFKSLRRALPVTRQKVEWDKISGYKLGADLKA